MALKIVKITDSKTSEQFEAIGLQAFESGDLDKAAKNLLSALELNDKNAELYLKLGVVLLQQGHVEKALVSIKQSIELSPYVADAYNAMGVVLYHLELWGAAEKFFRHALSLDPAHATAKKSVIEVIKHLRNGDNELPANFDSILALLEHKEPTLSLCMIVKNEEEFLDDCLTSVKGVVDEIIIVDTGSTDRTVEIAERHGARIFHTEWTGDFATARNESLRHATSDWILVLDADETIPAEYHDELRKALRNKDNVGYSLIIENLLGKDGESRQMAMIFRLFQNRPDLRYEGIIHEQIILSAQRTGMPLGNSHARIIHRGYLNQYMDQRDKHQRNLAILLEQEKQEPKNPYVHFNLGQTYKLLSRYEDSERSFLHSLELLKAGNVSHAVAYYANLYFSLAELYRIVGKNEEAIDICNEAIEHYPTYPDVVFTKGHTMLNMGRYQEAIECFEQCRKFQGVVFAAGNDPSVTTYKSANAMGVAYSRLGKQALAKQYFEKALKEWPYPDAELFTNLGILHLQDGDPGRALEYFSKAVEANDRYFRAWFNLGTVCYTLGHFEEAHSAWVKARDIDPEPEDMDFLIGEVALKLGRYEEAHEAFERTTVRNPQRHAAWSSMAIARLCREDVDGAMQALKTIVDTAEDESVGEARSLMAFVSLFGAEPHPIPEPSVLPYKRTVELWLAALDYLMRAERYQAIEHVLTPIRTLELPGLAEAVGRFLYRNGLHEAAMVFLLIAREATPEAPDLYYLLGECAVADGNLEDARVMYEMALSLNPRLMKAREKLSQLAQPQAT